MSRSRKEEAASSSACCATSDAAATAPLSVRLSVTDPDTSPEIPAPPASMTWRRSMLVTTLLVLELELLPPPNRLMSGSHKTPGHEARDERGDEERGRAGRWPRSSAPRVDVQRCAPAEKGIAVDIPRARRPGVRAEVEAPAAP